MSSTPGGASIGSSRGQDRLVPLYYLATLAVRQQSETIKFNSGAEMLDTFGMQQGGSQYRRLFEPSTDLQLRGGEGLFLDTVARGPMLSATVASTVICVVSLSGSLSFAPFSSSTTIARQLDTDV